MRKTVEGKVVGYYSTDGAITGLVHKATTPHVEIEVPYDYTLARSKLVEVSWEVPGPQHKPGCTLSKDVLISWNHSHEVWYLDHSYIIKYCPTCGCEL